jgi:hypothetical protein
MKANQIRPGDMTIAGYLVVRVEHLLETIVIVTHVSPDHGGLRTSSYDWEYNVQGMYITSSQSNG